MGVLEEVGRSAPVRGVLPRFFLFYMHALRLILMQSGQRNVDEMKYTIIV